MKKALFILLFCCFIVGLNSCKKFIDIDTPGQVLQTKAFSTENGFSEALIGSYIQMGPDLYASNLTMTMISEMGQNYLLGSTAVDQSGRYNYTDEVTREKIDLVWGNMYKAIGGVNNILANIDIAKNIFKGDHYNLVKGQALGLRAYMHFDLLRLFGPVPLRGANETAIPYVTTWNTKVTPSSTTSEVIALCLKDLDEAEQLLSVNQNILYDSTGMADESFYSYTRNRFNYWAVKALKARIYLYAGDKINALRYAKEVIASEKFPFINPSNLSTTSNRDPTFSTEHIFALNISSLITVNDTYFRSSTTRPTPLFSQSKSVITTLFELSNGGSTDLRYLYLLRAVSSSFFSVKFYQDNLTAIEVTNQMPMIRLSEMYYIAAETTTDLGEATTLINTIRSHRGLIALNTTLNETTRMKEIEKEYNKEFYAEGQLFFYYKRLGIPVPRSPIVMTDATFVLPIPDLEIEFGSR